MIKIAIAKGYLFKEANVLLKKCNIQLQDDLTNSRKLSTTDTTNKYQVMLVRPWDVTEYVEQGSADIGIVGLDVLAEKQSCLLRLLDLKFSACKLVLACPEDRNETLTYHMNVATKYPNLTKEYFNQKGIKSNIIKLYGAIELAPSTGLSDMVVDLTATGNSLRENNLKVVDTIIESTALLVANKSKMVFHSNEITDFYNLLKQNI